MTDAERIAARREELSDSFLEHAARSTSQYDSLLNQMAAEILELRGARAALEQTLDTDRARAFVAGWSAGFQEALTEDIHPEQDRCAVAYEEWKKEMHQAGAKAGRAGA